MSTLEQYKLVLGHLFKKQDLAEWNENHFLQTCKFIQRYMNENGKIGVKKEVFERNEADILNAPPSFETELLYRIGYFTGDPDIRKTQKFQRKLQGLVNLVTQYLKLNPGLISDRLKEEITKTIPLEYALVHYLTFQTQMGAQITMPDNRLNANTMAPVAKTPEVQLAEIQIEMVGHLRTIASSLTKQEIKSLKATDKINALVKLWPIVSAQKFQSGVQFFQQININRAGREDLEKELFDFNKIRDTNEN